MKILAIANHKGGTGKTTAARNIAGILSARGVRVLLVDSDPQGSLTLACGIDPQPKDLTNVYAVGGRKAARLADVLQAVGSGLDLAPAGLSLTLAESELIPRPGREFILADALAGVAGRYDLAVIDCPPNMGLLVSNALCAADAVIIPSGPGALDISGAAIFLDTIKAYQANPRLNPRLIVLGFLLTFYDGRLTTHQGGRAAMLGAGWPVLPVTIPRSVRVAESVAAGQSITSYEPGSPPAAAYKKLGEMVQIWLQKNVK